MVRNSSEQKLDYLDNLYLEKEIENTFLPRRERHTLQQPGGGSGHCVLPRPDAPAPPQHRSYYTLDEAVSMNINNTLNNSCFSIYGGSNNGIWSNKQTTWQRQTMPSSVTGWSSIQSYRPTCHETAERDINLMDDFPFFYSDTPRGDRHGMLSALQSPSTPGSSLTGRLIEDTLKIPLTAPNQQEQKLQPFQPQSQFCHSGQNDRRGNWRFYKEHKEFSPPEMKGMTEFQRKDTKRHDRKNLLSSRTNETTGDVFDKGNRSDNLGGVTEAGSLRNVLEASEIWLRNTTTSNFSNKKQILKKHFINQDQFYVGVS